MFSHATARGVVDWMCSPMSVIESRSETCPHLHVCSISAIVTVEKKGYWQEGMQLWTYHFVVAYSLGTFITTNLVDAR